MIKNADNPLSFRDWWDFSIKKIAEYHGYLSHKSFDKAIKEIVPDFDWHYSDYIKAFEIYKSPLWRALS